MTGIHHEVAGTDRSLKRAACRKSLA